MVGGVCHRRRHDFLARRAYPRSVEDAAESALAVLARDAGAAVFGNDEVDGGAEVVALEVLFGGELAHCWS